MSFKRSLWSIAMVVLCSVAHAQGEAQSVIKLDIPAQRMTDALNEFARQSGLQVLIDWEDSREITSPRISGTYTPQAALQKLLADTGLLYEYLDPRTISVRAHKSKAGASSDNAAGAASSAGDTPIEQQFRLVQSATQAQSNVEDQLKKVAEPDASSQQDRDIKEIIVTARKTEERIQDVPITITAIGEAQLKEVGATDIRDVLRSIPGLSYGGEDRGFVNYSIRAITNTSIIPTTGIYLDDIPITTNTSAGPLHNANDVILFDIERVEVLKGPQGTLYGGNAMGGAIKYVSASPDPTQFSASVAANLATMQHGGLSYGGEAVVNAPLVPDVLAVRGGFYYKREGGYIDNVADALMERANRSSTAFPVYTPETQSSLSTFNKENANFGDLYVGRLSLLWQPDPSLSIKPSIFVQHYKSNVANLFYINQPKFTVSNRFLSPTTDESKIHRLEIVKDFGGVELTSLTSYYDRLVKSRRENTFFIGSLIATLFDNNSSQDYPTHTKALSQEIRLASSADSTSPLRWLAGLIYTDQRVFLHPIVTTAGAGVELGTGTDQVFNQTLDVNLDHVAVFGEASYEIVPRLEVTAGVRVYKFIERVIETHNGLFNGGLGGYETNTRLNGVNPKYGLSYKIDEDHLLYGSAAKGFRIGGPVANAGAINATPACVSQLQQLGFSQAPTAFGSDNLWSYEIGSKNEFAGGRVRANAAAFYIDWKGIQQGVTLSCGYGLTINAGAAEVKGLEFETNVGVTDDLELGGTLTYTHAEITEAAFGGVTNVGDQILGVPKWMASAYASYFVPISESWTMRGRIDYQYRNEQHNSYIETMPVRFPGESTSRLLPNPGEFSEGYDGVNGNLSFASDRTVVRLFANNIFNKQPILSLGLGNYPSTMTTLRPRTIGIEVRQKF